MQHFAATVNMKAGEKKADGKKTPEFYILQNSQLLVEARAARTYRDELDALRERAVKADKLESEVGRYREQLHKIEFYKAKVEVRPLLGDLQMTDCYWESNNPK